MPMNEYYWIYSTFLTGGKLNINRGYKCLTYGDGRVWFLIDSIYGISDYIFTKYGIFNEL